MSKKKIIIGIVAVWLIGSAVFAIGYAVKSTSENAEGPIVALEDEDDYIAKIKAAVPNGLSEDDKLEDVSIIDKDLVITVTLGADKGAFADMPDDEYYAMQAPVTYGAITDAILELDPKYDSYWDTITVKYPGIGSVSCGKDALDENEAGRYFNPSKIGCDDYPFVKE